MKPKLDRHTLRRIRLLEALQDRHIDVVYRSDPGFRRDLAQEVAFGAKHPEDALLTPDLFFDGRAQRQKLLQQKSGPRPVLGGPPSAASVGAPPLTSALTKYSGASGGTVVLVPGGMASSLYDRGSVNPGQIWLKIRALLSGRFYDLQLAPYTNAQGESDLTTGVKIEADGTVPMLYDWLVTALWNDGWTPYVAAYDWRKDMENDSVAMNLKETIKQYAAGGNPVHIITHSQGGIVGRKALQLLESDVGTGPATSMVGQVIMLGPANYGAFVAALAVAGDLGEIPLVKMFPTPSQRVQTVLASFTGLYQLMPWDEKLAPSLKEAQCNIRSPKFWRDLSPGAIDFDRLDRAFPKGGKPWASLIDTTSFNKQITVIRGSRPFVDTPGGVQIVDGALQIDTRFGLPGDGWVPHKFARLPGTTTYLARRTGHIGLPMAGKVIQAILDILNGNPVQLPKVKRRRRRRAAGP
jgi:Lecithin:cholesterol acyltransferase